MIVRVLKGALFLTLFAGLLLTALYWYGSQDLPGYDDRGLAKLAQAKPTRGFNAADHLAFLEEENFEFPLSPEMREKLQQNLTFKEWSLTEVMEVLSENGDYIQSFIYASDQAYLLWPVSPDDMFDAPAYDGLFILSRLVTLKAQLLLASGNIDAAIDHALVPLRFSALMMHEYGGDAFLSYIVGAALQSRSLALINEIAHSSAKTLNHIENLQVAIERLPEYRNDRFDRTLAKTFARDAGYVDSMAPPEISQRVKLFQRQSEIWDGGETASAWTYRLITTLLPRYFLHVNRHKEALAAGVSAVASQHGKYCNRIEFSSVQAYHNPLSWLGPFSPNAAGSFEADYGQLYAPYLYRRCLLYTEREALRAQLAFEGYRAVHGNYPSDPAELVPEFLNTAPRDFFDGEPLRYSRLSGILYSVGENGVDDGGNLNFAALGYYGCSRDAACRNNPTFALPSVSPQDASAKLESASSP